MKILILGASLKPSRYSFLALNDLVDRKYDVLAVGARSGVLRGIEIMDTVPKDKNIHTVTLYLGVKNQVSYVDYLIKLKPVRVIFNPGTENPDLEERLVNVGVEVLHACTLVMLRTNQF